MLFMLLVLLLSPMSVTLFGGPFDACTASEPQSTKEALIHGILGNLQHVYYFDRDNRGKTFEIVIKDFDPVDVETYGILEKDGLFYVIDLRQVRDENGELTGICCKEFSLRKARDDLVAATKAKGLRRRFRVPLREEELFR